MQEQTFKRHIAYKMRIGEILAGKPILENERFKVLELGDKKIARVNVIANVIDKYIQEGERKFASITLDDSTGQLKIKAFGEETNKFDSLTLGDTILVIGLLRSWNNEVYITPEIIKKKEPAYLLVRKIESELEKPKTLDKDKISMLKSKIIEMVKTAEEAGGIEIEKIIMDLHEPPEIINQEIKKLLEEGVAYEPRPGKLRYLG